MPYCIKCGQHMFDGAEYCYYCGQISPFAKFPVKSTPEILYNADPCQKDSVQNGNKQQRVQQDNVPQRNNNPVYSDRIQRNSNANAFPYPVYAAQPTINYPGEQNYPVKNQGTLPVYSTSAVRNFDEKIIATDVQRTSDIQNSKEKQYQRKKIILICIIAMTSVLIGLLGWYAYREGIIENLLYGLSENYVYSSHVPDEEENSNYIIEENAFENEDSNSNIENDETGLSGQKSSSQKKNELSSTAGIKVPVIKETKLYSAHGITITAERLDMSDPNEPTLELIITNNSGTDLTFACDEAYVNGKFADALLYIDVLNEESAYDLLSVYGYDPENAETKDIGEIGFTIYMLDMDGEKTGPDIPMLKIPTNLKAGKEYVYEESEKYSDEAYFDDSSEYYPEEVYDDFYSDADESLWYEDESYEEWSPIEEYYDAWVPEENEFGL